MKKWLIILSALPILVILAGIFKFDILSHLSSYDIDGNKKVENKTEKVGDNTTKVEMMKIKIPSLQFNNKNGEFEMEYETFEVKKDPAILKISLEKLFEKKSGDSKHAWNGTEFNSVTIDENDFAIIKLDGRWFPVGDMSGMYFKREIEAVVKEFKNIKGIRVYLNNEIFDWCADDLRDGCINESGEKYRRMYWNQQF